MFKKRAKVLSLIIILINLVTFPASSEIVNKINVTGNDRISDQTIIMFSDINLNDDLNLNDLDQILKKIYQSNFFDNVNVSLNNNILTIKVDEKPIIETIRYDGVKSDEIRAEIIKTRILKPRSSYDELSLAEDRNKIFSKFKELGYYFASIETAGGGGMGCGKGMGGWRVGVGIGRPHGFGANRLADFNFQGFRFRSRDTS